MAAGQICAAVSAYILPQFVSAQAAHATNHPHKFPLKGNIVTIALAHILIKC